MNYRRFVFMLSVAVFLMSPPGVALGRAVQSTPNASDSAHSPLKIAIVGDASLHTVVLDGSPLPCGPVPFPAVCQYQALSAFAYPNVLSDLSGNTVFDLSLRGGAAPSEARTAQDILQAQVPQIAPDADFVILNVSTTMVFAGEQSTALQSFDDVVARIRERAPLAHLIVFGQRDSAEGPAARIVAWNLHAQRAAMALGGTYVDMHARFPERDYADFPDAIHPSQAGSQLIARLVAQIISPTSQTAVGPVSSATAGPNVPVTSAPRVLNARGLAVLPPRRIRLKIAIVGASMERNVVLDSSPIPCGLLLRAPACEYEDQSPIAYPNVLGALANATIYNFSVGGAQAADAKTNGTIPNALDSQVPQIPLSADVVVLDIGVNDMSISGATEGTLSRIDKVVAGVRARVPHARLIFLNLRDYATSVSRRLDAWNAREKQVAASLGATFIDLRKEFPASDYVDFPDGTHASSIGSFRIAQLINTAVLQMRLH